MIVLQDVLNGFGDCLLREMNIERKYLVRKIYFSYGED